MSRGNHTFRQGDVMRAIKATLAAGQAVARVEIDKDGRIVIVTKDGATNTPSPSIVAGAGELDLGNNPDFKKWLNED